jgi:hypothetical protein
VRQSHEPQRLFRSKVLAGLALAAVIAALLGLATIWPEDRNLWGDEGTYVAMTASLVRDGDLVFDDADLQHLSEHPDDPAPTVILQKTRRGVTYSKPLLYPWMSAPLYAVMGETGLVATNMLSLTVALVLAWIYLRRLASSSNALATLLTFALASVVLVYLGWKMSDLALLSLTLSGLVLALGGRRLQIDGHDVTMPFGSLGSAILGGLLLGGAVSMRFTTAALAAAAAMALLLDRRWRRGLVVGVLSLSGFLAVSTVTVLQLGTANPYKAVRSSFNQNTGFPAGQTAQQAGERFGTRPATQSATWQPPLDIRRTTFSTLYFFVGRHTGLLFYFPAALILLVHILRRPDRVSLTLLAGVVAIVGFYLIWMPENYFGGATFVGNRYFLGAFPALLVALSHLPSKRSLAVAWILALIGWGSAVHSTHSIQGLDPSSQAHAYAGVFRRLPFESTAQRIDGLAERFWADDYVRFLDPFAAAAPWSFRLDSNHPMAEILVATDWDDQPLHFVVSPDTARVTFEVRDWRGQWSYSLPQASPGPPGLLTIPASIPWRHHSYWWNPRQIYGSRVLRLRLVGDGEKASAVVKYAGRGRELAPLAAEILGIEPPLPVVAAAGTETEITIQVRNTGRRPWKRTGLFPGAVGFRFVTGNQGQVAKRGSTPLPRNVPPRETLAMPMTIQWPDQPGTYQLAFDILREPTGALKSLGRVVLAVADVQVEARPSRDNREP